ncbi:Collagen alpha-6(VI) chain [Acropora cervicornis]|uniref:Collagen alpha-6(VI) chain n=1 Tax=Acropora cervicornis TaxID=6130 RepID=A0AAD9V4T0_ACRCE|nr:Collagen alpha-6(VI) chain [Acropora cervicornis]
MKMVLSGGDGSFSSMSLLTVPFLIMAVLAPKIVQSVGCPEFPKQLSVNCAPHSSLDQCKFDGDCTESKDHMCCLIGCQKMCLDPALIQLSIGGSVVCPVLPRPSSCPDQPNECSVESECSVGQKCCSDGCRMVCADPVAKPTTPPPSIDPWKSCNTSVDLAFIIDSSGSISRRNYVKVKNFVKYVARAFGISPSESRAGIVLYSTDASIKAQFDQYTSNEDFVKAVDGLPHRRQLTYIDRALRLAASQLFPSARKDVPKIALLMTDGKQTDPRGVVNLREASAPLRKQGVRVLAFGVGKNVNVRELRLTVERDEDVISVSNFDDLVNKVRTYTANLCAAAETEPIYSDADIAFLMDSSSGVSFQQFEMEKRFVKSMARDFVVSPLGPRAALVSYSATSNTVIGFSGYSSNVDFSRQINNARFMGGKRKIDLALIHTASLFRETGRVGLRIVILLTAGNYYTGPGSRSMSSVMSLVNSLDAHVYVIGIGPFFTKSLFTPMVRGPGDIFWIPSFNDLAPRQSRIARYLRLSANAFTYERAHWSADVIFLMDSSKYVTGDNYILEKNFVKLMARLLNLASNRSRAALLTFSDNAQLVINFDGYEDRAAFDAAVNTAPHQKGDRFIDNAFDSATGLLQTDSRATVPKYVILLTTGKPTLRSDSRSLVNASSSVWSNGGKVFVVAVLTGGYTISEFYPAVQRPADAFSVSSFDALLPEAPTIAARMMASWRAPVSKTFSADIAFIVDSSSSVSPFQYSRVKQFVGILSEYLNVEPGRSRGAFVTFGEAPVEVFNFDSYKLLSEYKTKVNEAPYLGSERTISSALSAAGILFSNARGAHPWISILVTSWRPDEIHGARSLEILARPLLSRGVWLYVLSIDENQYVGGLTPMLVEPRDAFSIISYRDLPGNIGPVGRHIVNDNFLFGHASFQVDIIFLMDSSLGVNSQNYEIEKRFVQRIAMHLGVFTGRSRAALVAYGGNSWVVFGFGGYHSNADFELRLNEALMFGGVRRVDRALDTAAALMLGARPTVPKAVMLIMTGDPSREADAMPITDSARPLRDLGAWLYVVAVGQTDPSELQKATIRPTDIYFAMSFSSLYGYISPVAKYIANTSVITGISQLNADIVFIVDCSSDVPYREYSTQKAFVRSLTQYLNIQPDRSRAALIVYGSRALTAVRLERSGTFGSELTKAPFLAGRRRFDSALSAARTVFENARENVPKIMMLFMAGKQAQVRGATSLKDAIEPLRQEGVTTFIFRIGLEPDLKELVPVVDSPENIFTFARFADMDARVPYVARQIPFNSALLGSITFAIEIVYILDSSDTVTLDQYKDEKTFVLYLARYLKMVPSHSRNAVISYGSSAIVVTDLGQADTIQAFDLAVNNASKIGGQRRMDLAIDTARTVLSNARAAIPKVVILLTTGSQPTGIKAGVLESSMQRLYEMGARLYAVSINAPTVNLPLKNTDGSDWFPVRSFMDLPIQVLPLARHIASDTAAIGPSGFVADVIFMLDSSSHVMPQEFLEQKEFVKLIARYLNITPGKSRGAVIVYSTNASAILSFGGYTTMSEFNAVIDRASPLSGRRRIDRAFQLAGTLFKNARSNVRKVAMLLTSGRQSPDGASLSPIMQALRGNDVVTYVTAVGSESDVPVQKPGAMFLVRSYSDLPQQLQSIARNMTAQRAPFLCHCSEFRVILFLPDPCKTDGCRNPYNIGCRVMNDRAQCICPSCSSIRSPICASDGVQDLNECLMRQQACKANFNVSVAKQGQCEKDCRSAVDIAFVIDSSGSIGSRNWERIKRYVKSIVSKFEMGSSATRMAIIVYSTNPRVALLFSSFQGTDMVNKVLDDMRWQRGSTYTDKALLLAASSVFLASNGMRSNVPKVAVVITDGKQTTTGNYTNLSVASQRIKDKGVVVYAVGIGKGADRTELEQIASGTENVLISSSFKELQNTSTAGLSRYKGNNRGGLHDNNPDSGCHANTNIASIGGNNWIRMKRFVKSVVSKLDIGSSSTRIAAIAYSTNPKVVWRFNDYQGKDMVNRVLDNMAWQRGLTYTDRALLLAGTDLFQTFNGMRVNVPKFAVVITDGKQAKNENYTELSVASRGLKDKGVGVYAVGVGKSVSGTELEDIASGTEFVLRTVSFEKLSTTAEEVAKRLCRGRVPATTSTTRATPSPSSREMTPVSTTSVMSFPDPCRTIGCNAPYNTGCKVRGNKAECICPTCRLMRRPVCASDGVQDLSECHLRQQACLAEINVGIAKRGRCDKVCRSVVDMAFVIDSSGSVGRKNWERMKRFVKVFVSKFDVGSSTAHVAAIAYSSYPEIILQFRNYQGTDEVNRRLDRMRWQRGYTYTDKALGLADSQLFQTSTGMRQGVGKLAVVITDGRQTKTGPYTKLSVASQGIKNKGVIVYAVGVGSGVYKAELEEIASTPDKVFISSTFEDLQKISSELTSRMCEGNAYNNTKGDPINFRESDHGSTNHCRYLVDVHSKFFNYKITDPCETDGCTAPYNKGCRVVNRKAQCICPTCPKTLNPVCASDGVQDQSECHMRQQACIGNVSVAVEKRGPCEKECLSVVDIAFLIDSSESIGRRNWERIKRFVKALVSKLDVRSSATHVAAIAYSTNPIVELRFWNSQSTNDVNRVIDEIPWQRGFTYTDKALQLADSDLFKVVNGMRPDVPKLAVVITVGKQTKRGKFTALSLASRGIKSKGVVVYAVGVGSGVDRTELEEIASGSQHVFISSSFSELHSISLGLTRRLCEALPTPNSKTTQSLTSTVLTQVQTTADPCKVIGCNAPYNFGCQVLQNVPQCICPTCPETRSPVCASDGVQDQSECHMKRQACIGNVSVAVEKRGPCDKQCRSIFDIAFIIDSSGSIGKMNWEKMKRFVKSLLSKLDISPSTTHVAAIAYSTYPVVEMRFWNSQSTDKSNDVIDAIPWQRGLTYTDKALQLAATDLFQIENGMRRDVNKVAVVITDGRQTTEGGYTRLSVASQGLKSKGVTVFVVGVGKNVDQGELQDMTSGPSNVFTAASFTHLQELSSRITTTLCEIDPKGNYSRDVLFILDSSSVSKSSYNTSKELVKSLARYLDFQPQETRAALVVSNTQTSLMSDFESFGAVSNFTNIVDGTPLLGGDRSVSEALRTAATMFPKSSSASKVIFLITSGKPLINEDGNIIGNIVDKLGTLGVRVYFALIDPDSNLEGFRESSANVFTIESRSDISQQVDSVGSQLITDSATPKKQNLTMYVLFVLDSSQEVSRTNFLQQKEFVKSFISRLNIYPADSSASSVGIMIYSDEASMVMDFQTKPNKSIEAVVDNISKRQGSRRIDKALKAASDAFEDIDTNDPKFVILFAAGQQNHDPRAEGFSAAVRPLHRTGVKTHILAIGDRVDPAYFRQEDEQRANVVPIASFSDLPQSANQLAEGLLQDYVYPKEPFSTTGTTASTEKSTTKSFVSASPRVAISPSKEGSSTKSDIVFLVDTSKGVTQTDLNLQREFVKYLGQQLGVSPGKSHAAVLSYSDRPRLIGGFYAHLRGKHFEEVVDSVTQTGGKRNIEEALIQAKNMLNMARPTVPYVVFLIAYGKQALDLNSSRLRGAAQGILDMGARLYVIGVGVDGSEPQFQTLVTRSADFFQIPSSQDLRSHVLTITYNVGSGTRVPENFKVKVVYVLDSSTFVGAENFELEKDFTKALARLLNHNPNITQSAVITFDSFPKISIAMGSVKDIRGFSEAVDNLRYSGGDSQLHFALTVAGISFSRDDPTVPQIIIIITNRDPTNRDSIDSLARNLPRNGKSTTSRRGKAAVYVVEDPLTQPTQERSTSPSTTLSSTATVTAKTSPSVKATSTTTKRSTISATKQTSLLPKTTSSTTLFPDSTTKSSPPRALCVRGVDIAFLMDSSESITEDDFQREKTAVKEIAQSFLNSAQDSRAGVIMYSGEPELSVDFVGRREFEYFKSAVDGLAHRRSLTRIDRAIRFASRTLFANPRTTVMSIAVVMTDGVQTPQPDAEPLSQAVSVLNSKGVRVLAVGVGPRVNRSELNELVTSQEDVFQMSSFQELLDKSAKLLETVCPGKPGIPKVVIVMTDGRQTQEPDAMSLDAAAAAIHTEGAHLLVVGVGPKLSMTGLRMIAQYPSNIFTVQSFENLASTMQDVVKSACGDFTTPTLTLFSCPPRTEPPRGVCASRKSTCFGDESCSSIAKCCYDGCRFSCVGRDGELIGTPTTTPPPGPQCNKAFDLGFAMDSSGSIRDANYQKQKDFIREFSHQLDLGSRAVQLGLIVFSDLPILSVRFGTLKSTDRSSFAAAVDAVPYFRGRTRIDSALDTAAEYLFPEGRQNVVPQIFFLITDGRQSQDAGSVPLDRAVRPLEQKGIKVVVIGVGDDVDRDELKSLVVNPSEDIFFVPSFDDLKPLLDNPKLKSTLCIPKRRRLKKFSGS